MIAFEELQPPNSDIPQGLKQEVFNSLETLQLIADIIDLFTFQFVMSEAEFTNMLGASLRDDDSNDEDNKEEEE